MKFWIGEYLRQGRVVKGYTQGAMAGLIDCTQSHICRIEKGVPDPGFHEVIELLKFLGLPYPVLVDGVLRMSSDAPGNAGTA
ncbi:MAG: helix-turn-helix domain-containing protein [Flavobacteriales bacterium]|nr:helix-turn-helix domain-containing protein [Flavobacteriales bacterium]